MDDMKVTWGGKTLLVHSVDVNVNCDADDITNVTIGTYLPPYQAEQTLTLKMVEDGKNFMDYFTKTITGEDKMAYQDEPCDMKACDDGGSYGARQLAKRYLDLDLPDDEKLVRKYKLTNLDGTLTERGKEMLFTVLWDNYREEVVEALKELDDEESDFCEC